VASHGPYDRDVEVTDLTILLGSRAVAYELRRSSRSRGIRISIDQRRGLVVSIPPATRRGWSDAASLARVEAFLRERERWILRHLDRLARERAAQLARGGARDGGAVRYRGELHRVRVARASAAARRSTVERAGADDGDELVIRVASRDRRAPERVLEAWLRDRAREAINRAAARHAPVLGVSPRVVDLRDPRTRWASASKDGRLMFSWRLVLATPDALETVVVHELAHLKVFGHGPRFWALVASRRPSHLADRAWLRRHSHELHAALETSEAADVVASA
jgi:predicted metal-dependent hydrolase